MEASTRADKPVSGFADAERLGPRGVQWLRCRVEIRPLIPPPMLRQLLRPASLIALAALASACQSRSTEVSPALRQAIADTLTSMVKSAYDLKAPNPVARPIFPMRPARGVILLQEERRKLGQPPAAAAS